MFKGIYPSMVRIPFLFWFVRCIIAFIMPKGYVGMRFKNEQISCSRFTYFDQVLTYLLYPGLLSEVLDLVSWHRRCLFAQPNT